VERGEEGYRETEQGQSVENPLASPVREFWAVVGKIRIHVVSEITGEAAAERSNK